MSAATATVGLVELDTASSMIEAAAKKVRLELLRATWIAFGGAVCVQLHRTQTTADRVRGRLSELQVTSDEQRCALRDIAINLGQGAKALQRAYEDAERRRLVKIPVFGNVLMTKLEDLACTLEDMAETAAFGADEAFSRSLSEELVRNLEAHQRATA